MPPAVVPPAVVPPAVPAAAEAAAGPITAETATTAATDPGATAPAGGTPGATAAGSADVTAAATAVPAASAVASSSTPAPDTATAPAAATETITQPEPVVPPVAGEVAPPGVPTFDVVRVEPGGDAVMAGRSEPGMVIALFANGKEIGRTRANDSGEWVITLEEPLGPGEYVVTIVGATADGARQVESVDRIAVSIPEGKSEPPMVALMSPDAPTRVLQQPEAPAAGTAVAAASGAPAAAPSDASSGGPAATAGAAGGAAPAAVAGAPGDVAPPPAWAQPFATGGADATSQTAATASPSATAETVVAAAPQTPAAAALAVGVVEKDGDTVTVSGASQPGATVRLYVNDAPVGEAVADAAGRWTFTGPHAVGPGDHTVRADQIDPATGTVMARAAVPFEVLSAAEIADAPATPETPAVALPPPTAAETAMIAAAPEPAATPTAPPRTRTIRIRRGDDLWTLAQRHYGKRRGVRYTAIYRANRKQIRNPDLIYPGQVIVIPR
jgi:nucleoid-associated protein YgaU